MKNNRLTDAKWIKSSRSNGQANCVEVASAGDQTAARDSKNPSGPMLVFPTASWTAFVGRDAR